jgi:hypothetical protein
MLWLAGLAAAVVLAPALYVGIIRPMPPAS